MSITIAIPAYNAEKTIAESVASALEQKCKGREILILDDGSTDGTLAMLEAYGMSKHVRIIRNEQNRGIGEALARLMHEASSKYIVYLCADDQFVDDLVVSDYQRAFKTSKRIWVIGRYYYQYMDGYPGPIMVSRDKSILTQSCNPSGMAFKVEKDIKGTNKIFIEMPSIVRQYLFKDCEWTMLEYDTIKARIHPGGNTGTKKEYYQGSMYQNWHDLLGEPIKFHQGFIQIKNRAPANLWREICVSVKLRRQNLYDASWWFHVLIALVVPGFILRPLANWYRHRITRRFVSVIKRPNDLPNE